MLTFTQRKAQSNAGKHPVDKLWITPGFSVDNPVDKLWVSCVLLWIKKLSTSKFTKHPQGYPQGYPQGKWSISSVISRDFSLSGVKKRGPLLQLFIYIN